MIILRAVLRIPFAVGRLLLKLVRKLVKVTLLAAAAGTLLVVLDALLLDSDDARPDGS